MARKKDKDLSIESLKEFSDEHDELIKDMIFEKGSIGSTATKSRASVRSNHMLNLPLPWEQVIYDNQLYMFLNSNDYYSISVPTSFYVIGNSNATVIDTAPQLIDWKIPMAPKSLLYQFMTWASVVYNEHHSEVEAMLAFNKNTNSWKICYPKQVISGASVSFNLNDSWMISCPNDTIANTTSSNVLREDDVLLVDLHSHHVMTIGFSAIDDHSDQLLGAISHISIVLKMIDRINFLDLNKNFDIRLTVQGKSYDLEIDDVFIDDVDYTAIMNDVVEVEPSSHTNNNSLLSDEHPFYGSDFAPFKLSNQ